MKKIQKSFIIPLFTAIVLAAIGGASYVWQKQKATTPSEATITPTTETSEPVVTVTTPNGNEVWKMSEQKYITWNSLNLADDAKVAVRLRSERNFFDFCDPIDGEVPAKQELFPITPSNTMCVGKTSSLPKDWFKLSPGEYKVEIGVTNYGGGKGVNDQSDASFTIVN